MGVRYVRTSRIATITLDRPEVLNALDEGMYHELNDALIRFREDAEAWVGVICGAGRAFCAGGDLDAVERLVEKNGWQAAFEAFDLLLFEECAIRKPLVAAIHGACIGDGLNIALGCDLRISGESAIFSPGGARIGMPSVHAAIRCTQIMQLGHAMELLLLGETRDANWAHRTGLVNEVVADELVPKRALECAERMCQVGPLAARSTKELAIRQYSMAFTDAVALGKELRRSILESNDAQEGVRAFRERRSPVFTGT